MSFRISGFAVFAKKTIRSFEKMICASRFLKMMIIKKKYESLQHWLIKCVGNQILIHYFYVTFYSLHIQKSHYSYRQPLMIKKSEYLFEFTELL